MAFPLPYNPLPGADVPNTLAEAQQANNEKLAQAIPVVTPLSRGLQSIAINPTAASATVNHGLAGTPAAVVATPNSSDVRADVFSLGATSFTLRLTSNVGTVNATYSAYWIAVL